MVSHSRAASRPCRLRPLNLPRPIAVETGDDDLPWMVIVDGTRHVVRAILETWRIDDEWWRDLISRRYVDAVLSNGRRIALFHDLVTGLWYMQRV